MTWLCHYCGRHRGIKTTSAGKLVCDRCLRGARSIRAPSTPGRNDPCPCGSGSKWKRCCMREGQ